MEWVLQLVDEIDDAIGVARHGWLGLSAHIGALFAGLSARLAAGSAFTLRVAPWRARI
jgi:hypothetical protein